MFLSDFVCMLIDVLLSANSRSELETISADVHWCYLRKLAQSKTSFRLKRVETVTNVLRCVVDTMCDAAMAGMHMEKGEVVRAYMAALYYLYYQRKLNMCYIKNIDSTKLSIALSAYVECSEECKFIVCRHAMS